MALVGSFTKQANEILDFDIDYAPVLAGRADTLSTHTTSVSPAGLTIVSSTINSAKIKVVVSAGSNTTLYKVTVLATTSPAGLKYEDEVNVTIEDV